ncbi:hypothetical protein LTR66_009861 [Elasticomyces elasticus]|nr:hypothetical protein LTR66_009861 [Elasticomyces elasticus]
MALHVIGFCAIMVVLWVLAPHVPASTALLEFTNAGGWSSTGLALMVGQITAVTGLASSDAAAHMSEEVTDAGLSVPRSMMWTFWVNGLMGFVLIITYIFCMPSVDDALHDPTGFPMIYVFNLAMPIEGTIIVVVLLLVLLMAGNISYNASTARQTFAFARDRGLPFSSWVSKVHPTLLVPVNAVILSVVLTCLISLINIGSSAAFNAIISLATVAQMSTYLISITCVLYRRVRAPHLLPNARWSLGRMGVAINTGAVAYASLVFFWSFWPNGTPVDATSFNWAPVMFVVVLVLSLTIFMAKGRRVYSGPVKIVEGHEEAEMELSGKVL